jgi:hypothetical protein
MAALGATSSSRRVASKDCFHPAEPIPPGTENDSYGGNLRLCPFSAVRRDGAESGHPPSFDKASKTGGILLSHRYHVHLCGP